MGMFDTIRCAHPLPDDCSETGFQTKSLGCLLETYVLTASGRLQDSRGADTGMHGVLRMYTAGAAGTWWVYEAKFTDGQLIQLLPASHAQYDDAGMAKANHL